MKLIVSCATCEDWRVCYRVKGLRVEDAPGQCDTGEVLREMTREELQEYERALEAGRVEVYLMKLEKKMMAELEERSSVDADGRAVIREG